MKTPRVLLLLTLLAAAAPAGAAVVRLKDGGSLEGSVVSATPQELVIRTAAGERRVDANRVLSVEYAASTPPVEGGYSTVAVEGKNEFSFGLGMASPLSDVDFARIGGGSANNGDIGPLIGLRYFRSVTKRFSAGVSLDYLYRSSTDSPGLLARAHSSVLGDDLTFMGLARWHMIDHGSARPYLVAGAGASRSWTRIEAAPIRGFAWTDTNTDEVRRLVDDVSWVPAAAASLGIDFWWDFAEPGVFSLEGGWLGLANRRSPATGAGRNLGLETVSSQLNFFTLSARWSWRW